MIRAFLFDYGGVMTAGGGSSSLSTDLAEQLKITPDRAAELLSPSWSNFVRGKITEQAFWGSIERRYGKPISTTQRDIWETKGMEPLPSMVQLVHRLKTHGYNVALLSNTIPATTQYLKADGSYDVFSFTVLSYEVGSAKPDLEIYTLALEQFGDVEPNQIVFLDDQERCLAPAREMGMQTILVTDASQAISEVNSLLERDHAH